MGSNKSPILLQRDCTAKFLARVAGATRDEAVSSCSDLTRAVNVARAAVGQSGQRAWVDLIMGYDGFAVNEAAKSRAGRTEVRLGSWEVFPDDVIFCPAGAMKLDPRWIDLAREATGT